MSRIDKQNYGTKESSEIILPVSREYLAVYTVLPNIHALSPRMLWEPAYVARKKKHNDNPNQTTMDESSSRRTGVI